MKNKIVAFVLILLAFTACKKDNPAPTFTLDTTSLTLTSGSTHQLVVNGSTTEKFIYSTDNNLIADVNEEGLVTGKRVGETLIKVSGSGFISECTSTVFPLYNTFKEPIMLFGITKTEVKAIEKRIFQVETDDGLLFSGGRLEKCVIYLFENGKLDGSCVILSSAYTTELGKYMAERYVIISLSPVLGVSVDNKFGVGTELQSNLDWWVGYFPHSINKSISINLRVNELLSKYRNTIIKTLN